VPGYYKHDNNEQVSREKSLVVRIHDVTLKFSADEESSDSPMHS